MAKSEIIFGDLGGGDSAINIDKIVNYTFTCTATQQTFTVNSLSKIRAVYAFIYSYANSSYAGAALDENGNLVQYTSVSSYGVDAISGNTFDFHWASTWACTAVVYGEE